MAFRETANLISEGGKIIPLIEPVKKNIASLLKSVIVYKETQMPFVLITNPKVGELTHDYSELQDKIDENILDYEGYLPGYIITSSSDINGIQSFLEKYEKNTVCLIHYQNYSDPDELAKIIKKSGNVEYSVFMERHSGLTYRNIIGENKKIILRDSFNLQDRNSDYPPDEFYTDLHKNYAELNFGGFGDFLIIGDRYFDRGGPAYTVAIHMSYLRSDGDIWIKHFLSENQDSIADTPGKYLDALSKLVQTIESNVFDNSQTQVLDEFRSLHNKEYYPGLGVVKKLSLVHHIQLINMII